MAPQTRSAARASTDRLEETTSHDLPHYTIDLSLPPRIRYREICRDYEAELRSLTALFDSILAPTRFPRLLTFLSKHLLKRVKCAEETEEMRGIAKEVGVGVYLVVAYNTFLDLFAGCVSGAVRTEGAGAQGRLLHFRGLDWDMEELRNLVISVDYVRDGKVVARSVFSFSVVLLCLID